MRGLIERDIFKDLSVGLIRLLCFLIVFTIGVVIGLISSSHLLTPSPTSIYITKTNHNITCLSFPSPRNLTHHMSDEHLFWRASFVPERKHNPFNTIPKIAFMFLTRKELPLLPLWERFFKGQDVDKYSIYVHTSPDFDLGVSNSSVFFNRQIPSQAVEWGTVSLVDAERRLLGNALLDFSNERFVLLSESCIPIYNFSTVYKYLISSLYSFLDSYDDPSRYGRGRYNRKMKPDIRLRDWRKGSQWFEMNRALAIKIISDIKYYNLFKKYCTGDCYPDEHYMPTFVHMFHGSLNADRTVTYVDWSLGGAHPAKFRHKDITENFLRSLRNNGTSCSYNNGKTPICYLFARKFDENALKPLLKLASGVFEY